VVEIILEILFSFLLLITFGRSFVLISLTGSPVTLCDIPNAMNDLSVVLWLLCLLNVLAIGYWIYPPVCDGTHHHKRCIPCHYHRLIVRFLRRSCVPVGRQLRRRSNKSERDFKAYKVSLRAKLWAKKQKNCKQKGNRPELVDSVNKAARKEQVHTSYLESLQCLVIVMASQWQSLQQRTQTSSTRFVYWVLSCYTDFSGDEAYWLVVTGMIFHWQSLFSLGLLQMTCETTLVLVRHNHILRRWYDSLLKLIDQLQLRVMALLMSALLRCYLVLFDTFYRLQTFVVVLILSTLDTLYFVFGTYTYIPMLMYALHQFIYMCLL
jgi:hypothetical protein